MNINNFTKINPILKTIELNLVPVKETLENMTKNHILESDVVRAEKFETAKKYLNMCHKQFVDEVIKLIDVNFLPLTAVVDDNKAFKKEARPVMKSISEAFTTHPFYDNLFGKKSIDETILNIKGLSPDQRKEVAEVSKYLQGFTSYFSEYEKSRTTIYGVKEGSIAYRIVMDNFKTFAQNNNNYIRLLNERPEVVVRTKEELCPVLKITEEEFDNYFYINNYCNVIAQKDITMYNTILNGIKKDGVQYRGLNSHSYEYKTQEGHPERIMFNVLDKQILSDEESLSDKIKGYQTDKELMNAVSHMFNDFNFDKLNEFLKAYSEAEAEYLFINNAGLHKISSALYNSHNVIPNALLQKKIEEMGGEEKAYKTKKNKDILEKYQRRAFFSLAEVIESEKYIGSPVSVYEYLNKIKPDISGVTAKFKEVKENIPEKNLRDDDKFVEMLKSFLDTLIDIKRDFDPFRINGNKTKEKEKITKYDVEVYKIYDECQAIFGKMNNVYNKCRNYVTMVPYSKDVIPLNFGFYSFLGGWSVPNDKGGILLKKKNGIKTEYFLGILNNDDKPEGFKHLADDKETKNYYEVMQYISQTSAAKILPKLIFLKEVKEHFAVSDEDYILFTSKYSEPLVIKASVYRAYEDRLHNNMELKEKNPKEFAKITKELISLFVEFFDKYKSMQVCEIRSRLKKPIDKYETVSEFFSEVDTLMYNHRFIKVAESRIDKWVKEGSLYLFKITNRYLEKEYCDNPSLYTSYFLSAFDDKNEGIFSVTIKGNAKVFYRKKSDFKETTHKKGSYIVNKIDMNGDPVPGEIIRELSNHFNYKSKLSKEAEDYLDKVTVKKADFDIIKDKRFHYDGFKLNLTIGFNSDVEEDKSPQNTINDMVCRSLDKKYNIVSLTRSKNSLLNLAVMDSDGNEIEFINLDTIDGINYSKGLMQRKKEALENQKAWRKQDVIKKYIENYISKVVNIVCTKLIQYDAVLVCENPSYSFSNHSFRLDKHSFRTCVNAIEQKLTYFAIKNIPVGEKGSVSEGFQLAVPTTDKTRYGQNGVMIFTSQAFTANIDPESGYADLFKRKDYDINNKTRAMFVKAFDSIVYNGNSFEFKFNYKNFETTVKSNDAFTAYSKVKIVFNKDLGVVEEKDCTKEFIALLESDEIEYKDGEDLRHVIANSRKVRKYYDLMIDILSLGFERINMIQSPVSDFKVTDIDRFAAFNMTRRGIEAINAGFEDKGGKLCIPPYSNEEWFRHLNR